MSDADHPPCGAITKPDGSVLWRVWAPHAASVELILFDGDAQSRTLRMSADPSGYYVHREEHVREGQRYAFRLDGGPARPDPAGRWQPDDVHGSSAAFFPDRFSWSDSAYAGVCREELVFYELHVGTFTSEGTFDAVIPRLETLRELGITAIELMPVGQFPGTRGWGYDGVLPYAVHHGYGGPRALQRLVDSCHRHGLAVVLDVVYNHFGPEGNYLAEFGPYFTDRYATPWGRALNYDGRGCDGVRAYVLENARQWIRDYRLDGLRLDAVHTIYDFGARHILLELGEAVREEGRRLGRPVHVIAESNLNDVRLLDPLERGGYDLDAQWSDDFHHAVHALLTGERDGYYTDFGGPAELVKAVNKTFVYDGVYSVYRGRRHGAPAGDHPGDRFVVSVQTHDQVGNRARGDRLGTLLDPPQQRLAAGLLLLAPYLPLLFMGEEYGETCPFPFFCSFHDRVIAEAARLGRRAEFESFRWQGEVPDPQDEATFRSAVLSWRWEEPQRAGLRRLYRDLLRARRRFSALRDFRSRHAEILGPHQAALLRLERGHAEPVVGYFNLCAVEQRLPERHETMLPPFMRSEAREYGGLCSPDDDRPVLLPYEFQIFGSGLRG